MSAEKPVTIEYPEQTSKWGKALIDMLNVHFLNVTQQFKGLNDNLNDKFSKLTSDIDAIRATAEENKSNIAEIRADMEHMKSNINYWKFTCENLTSENKQLKQQTNKLENYSRRSNVVIRGLQEEENEPLSTCEQKAKQFFRDELKLEENTVKQLKFVRCHRLGSSSRNQNTNRRFPQKRPIIVRFHDYSEKSLIWNARSNIRSQHVFLSENFSGDTEYNRRKLYPTLQYIQPPE